MDRPQGPVSRRRAPRSPRLACDLLTATSARRRSRRTAATTDGPERARTLLPTLSPRPARPGGGRRDDTAQRSPQAARDGPARVARRMRDPGTLRAVEVNHPSHEGWRTARRWPRRSCRTGRRAAGEVRQVRLTPYTRRGRLESQDPSAAQTNVPSRTRTTSREHPGSAGPDGHKANIGRHGDVPLRGGRPGGDATAARNPTCSPAEVDEREERPTVPLPLTSHRLRALSLTLAADVPCQGTDTTCSGRAAVGHGRVPRGVYRPVPPSTHTAQAAITERATATGAVGVQGGQHITTSAQKRRTRSGRATCCKSVHLPKRRQTCAAQPHREEARGRLGPGRTQTARKPSDLHKSGTWSCRAASWRRAPRDPGGSRVTAKRQDGAWLQVQGKPRRAKGDGGPATVILRYGCPTRARPRGAAGDAASKHEEADRPLETGGTAGRTEQGSGGHGHREDGHRHPAAPQGLRHGTVQARTR